MLPRAKLAGACAQQLLRAQARADKRAPEAPLGLDQYECQTCDEEPAKVEKITSTSLGVRQGMRMNFGSLSFFGVAITPKVMRV